MLPESVRHRPHHPPWLRPDTNGCKKRSWGARAAKTCELWLRPTYPAQSVLVFVGEGHGPWWEMEECEECGPGVAINYRELHTIDIVKLNTQLSSPDFLVKLNFQPILKALNNMETSEILLAFLWTFDLDHRLVNWCLTLLTIRTCYNEQETSV